MQIKYVVTFFIFVISLLSFGEFSNVYGTEFSYIEQIRYATISEKMVGHVIASFEAQSVSEHGDALALMHLVHPFEEEFDEMEMFYADLPEFKSKSHYILYVISNSDNQNDVKLIMEQARDTLSLVKQGQKLVLDDDLLSDKFFRLLLVNSLLEEVKIELIDSDNSEGLEKIIESQDAFGFAVRANMILKDTTGVDMKVFEISKNNFTKLFMAFGEKQSSQNIIKIIDDIVLNQYEYIIKEKPTFTYKDDRDSIQNERLVSLSEKMYAGKTLITFVGENFPENSNIELTYATSGTDELETLSVHTTSNGVFFIPIGFADENITYYLSVKCAERTTDHILNISG